MKKKTGEEVKSSKIGVFPINIQPRKQRHFQEYRLNKAIISATITMMMPDN